MTNEKKFYTVDALLITVDLQSLSPQILLGKRKKEPFKNDFWVLPGGHIENNELPEEALKREIEEETNLKQKIQDEILLGTYDQLNDPRRFYSTRAYICPHKFELSKAGDDLKNIKYHSLSKSVLNNITFGFSHQKIVFDAIDHLRELKERTIIFFNRILRPMLKNTDITESNLVSIYNNFPGIKASTQDWKRILKVLEKENLIKTDGRSITLV